jgi:hypothetical protein
MTTEEAKVLAIAIRKTGKKLRPGDEKLVHEAEIGWWDYVSMAQAKWLQDIYARVTGGGKIQERYYGSERRENG